MTVTMVLELVSDQGSSTNHFSNGPDTIGFYTQDGYLLPSSRLQQVLPVALTRGSRPESLVGVNDALERLWWCHGFSDVRLLVDVTEDTGVVDERFGFSWSEGKHSKEQLSADGSRRNEERRQSTYDRASSAAFGMQVLRVPVACR